MSSKHAAEDRIDRDRSEARSSARNVTTASSWRDAKYFCYQVLLLVLLQAPSLAQSRSLSSASEVRSSHNGGTRLGKSGSEYYPLAAREESGITREWDTLLANVGDGDRDRWRAGSQDDWAQELGDKLRVRFMNEESFCIHNIQYL